MGQDFSNIQYNAGNEYLDTLKKSKQNLELYLLRKWEIYAITERKRDISVLIFM